ncbi:MAG TPA: ribosome small subunit-dependent GTPase A [Clostridia bacterium]|nr:ribosome small subunit-dependent GTPase A [Clostridia bacterium]
MLRIRGGIGCLLLKEGIVTGCISDYFDVWSEGRSIRCKVRGRLKGEDIKVLVGDRVLISAGIPGRLCVDGPNAESGRDGTKGFRHLPIQGMIEKVLERKNELLRPPIANVDLVVLVFTLKNPNFNARLVDKILVLAESSGIEPILCLNKIDLLKSGEASPILEIYQAAGYKVYLTSALTGEGTRRLASGIANHTAVLAGQSGVGKSRLFNALIPGASARVGDISKKGLRGRHTTKHVELRRLPEGGFLADTPGFSRLDMEGIRKEELSGFFREMLPWLGRCKFRGCLHKDEPECAVKDAVSRKIISETRYRSYLDFLEELHEWETRRYE